MNEQWAIREEARPHPKLLRSDSTLYSDAKYVVDSVMRGSALRWRASGWKRGNYRVVPNADLWRRLLELCRIHEVEFVWVKGHAGNVEN